MNEKLRRFYKTLESILESLKCLFDKSKNAISETAVLVGDLNGDGKVDHEDAKIAAEWAKKTGNMVVDETAKLGKEAMRSEMAKDAAAGAVVGAAIAIPLPVIGPTYCAGVRRADLSSLCKAAQAVMEGRRIKNKA
jgi:hypothetical protein